MKLIIVSGRGVIISILIGEQPDFTRHITKDAEAFRIIVEECCNQSKSRMISNSAILKAKEKFGIVMADGPNIIY
jgi:hypothetical protein